MGTFRNKKRSIPTLLVAALIGLGAGAANAEASLVTWTLKGVPPFEFGEVASGYFTLDQATIESAPPGPTSLAGWHIEIAGGTNPQIPSIVFSDSDSGCLVACARFFKIDFPITGINFRTPLAADNTYYEFGLDFEASTDELILPTTQERVVPTGLGPFGTNIQFNEYLPSQNAVRSISKSDLKADGGIITSVAIPEPSSIELLAAGLAAISCIRRLRKHRISMSGR